MSLLAAVDYVYCPSTSIEAVGALGSLGDYEGMMAMLASLRDKKAADVSAGTYASAISGLLRAGEKGKARTLYEQALGEMELKLEQKEFDTILAASTASGDLEEAFFYTLERKRLLPG